MMDYVRLFQNKAGQISSSHQPNRPALVLYFGNIAMRSRKVLREKLLSQIPENYHAAIIEGAFCSSSEAGSIPCMEIPLDTGLTEFGAFANAWLNEHNQKEIDAFLTKLLHDTTDSSIAIAMAELDVYLIVGNDGGACELWPYILNALSRPAMTSVAVKNHLIWMYREELEYRQPRDIAMYRLIKAVDSQDRSAVEVKAIPAAVEVCDIPLSITLVSDRNQRNICSNDVWDTNCQGIAGFMLAHMFSSQTLPTRNTCAMFDAIFPDRYWSAGFQLSALLKLKAALEVQKAEKMLTFPAMLAQAWGITDIQGSHLITLVRNHLPYAADLKTLPINPYVDKETLKKSRSVSECISLLYGHRFDQFFEDALHGLQGSPFRVLVSKLTNQFKETLEAFREKHGIFATAALLNTEESESLLKLFQGIRGALKLNANLESITLPNVGWFANPIESRQQTIVTKVAEKKIECLHAQAVDLLLGELIRQMNTWKTEYQNEADALQSAIVELEPRLTNVFAGFNTPYHQNVQSYAQQQKLYPSTINEKDFSLLKRSFSTDNPVQTLIEVLTEMNLAHNRFITCRMQETFNQLGYLNGSSELRSALDGLCSAAVFSPATFVQDDVYILPKDGDWSNGDRVYGLIRIYTVNQGTNLLDSVSYLTNHSAQTTLTLEEGRPLPKEKVPLIQQKQEVAVVANQFEEEEAQKPLGHVLYKKPDSLITFEWPCPEAELLTLSISGTTDYGFSHYEQMITVSGKNYLLSGGAVLPNLRLNGNCYATIGWQNNGEKYSVSGQLMVDPVHISRSISEEGNKYILRLSASENVPNLSRYLLLQICRHDGIVVSYRLPDLPGGECKIPKNYCNGSPKIVLSDEKWNDYFCF